MLFGTLLKRILGSLFWKNKQKIPKQFNSIDAIYGPSINRLVTNGNKNLCCRVFILALFYSTTANKIDSEHYQRL